MRKMWIVARREYRATIRTKAFIIAMVLMPVLMLGGIGVQVLMRGRVDTGTKKIAVVDRSGRMFGVLREAVELRNQNDIFDGNTHRQIEPKYELLDMPPDGSETQQQQLLALSDRVRKGELFAFIVIPPNVLESDGAEAGAAIQYCSNQPTYENARRWLSRIIDEKVIKVRLESAGIDPATVRRALHNVSIENLGLWDRNKDGGVRQAEQVNEGVAFGVPIGLMMLMFMGLSVTSGPLLNSVLEEKMQRIAEVLLGSIAPFKLMCGKLIGYVGVAVTLVVVYFAGGYMVLNYYGYGDIVPLHLLAWFIVFQALAILMFGSMFMAIGACCNDIKEAQNLMLPVWLFVCIPMFALSVVMEHPSSLFSVLLSLFPPATPMLMLLRMGIPPGVAAWEPIVGVFGTLTATTFCIWAAGRIFRVGLLLQGKPPKFTDLARWVARG